ncbi:hypothetical protein Tco_0610111 [Tanacetum coccineum]
MEKGLLSLKGRGRGNGVKEKEITLEDDSAIGNNRVEDARSSIHATHSGSNSVDATMKDGVASAVKEGVTPFVGDMMVEKEKICSLDETTVSESFQTLTMPVTTTASNAPRKSSYANITGKPSGKKVNGRRWHTLFLLTMLGILGGKYGLVRSMFNSSIGLFSFQFNSMNGLDAMLESGPWFIRNNPLILKKWHPDENLLKEDVSTILVWVKFHGVPVTTFSEDGLSAIATKLGTYLMLDSYTSDMCMQSWGWSSYARVLIELRADVELKDSIIVAMPKITREGHYTCVGKKKTVKKPSQTFRGVPVGPKISFKPQKEYRPVLKKPNASSSGNKKKGMEPTTEVNNSNPFDVFNSVDNDVEFGKLRLLDSDGNALVPTGIVKSDSEVEVVFDETANLKISTSGKDGSDKGYGTNNLLEQWRDSYPDNDDYDPYDDDMYKNHDLSEHVQSICDDLDIMVRSRKKK